MIWTFGMVAIAVIVVIVGIFAIWAAKINAKEMKKFPGKYPEGHFISKGMAIFLPLGLVFGIPFDNIALGLPIGVAIGVAVGAAWEEKAKKEGKIRPLTKKEKEIKKKMVLLSVGLLALGLIAGVGFFFLTK